MAEQQDFLSDTHNAAVDTQPIGWWATVESEGWWTAIRSVWSVGLIYYLGFSVADGLASWLI